MIPYSLEGLIIDRLETKIDPTWIVMRSSSLTKTPKQHNHSIYVVPQELAVGHMRRGQVAIEESVLVVTAVRNASTQVTGEGSRFEAGPMLVVIINAVSYTHLDVYKRQLIEYVVKLSIDTVVSFLNRSNKCYEV